MEMRKTLFLSKIDYTARRLLPTANIIILFFYCAVLYVLCENISMCGILKSGHFVSPETITK
jgi:hypothetical protein